MSQQVRTRFAPSPTGHLHIGSARSALFSYLFAKHNNGSFIIRIEDTDQFRNIENAEEKLLNSLKWLGIDWDESVDIGGDFAPYRSMDRLEIYQKYINILIENKHAYYCYCTPEEIDAERQVLLEKGETPKYSGKCRHLTTEQKSNFENDNRKPSVRFEVPTDQLIRVEDRVRGLVEFESNGIGDFVIARPDGIPTYNFAVTIDDHLMEITNVIRGEEHLSNTPRQIMIYNAFSWTIPQFAHVSLILNQDRKKMSKRDESIIQFVEQYKELGFLPEAIINFIALLGWSPEGEEEIFSMEELIKQFSLGRVAKSPAVFDVQKLHWMNNSYIKKAPIDKIFKLCLPHLQAVGYLPETLSQEQSEWAELLVGLYIEKMNYTQEIVELTKIFFEEELTFDEEEKAILSEEHIPIVMEEFIKQVNSLEDFKPEAIKGVLKVVQKETGFKGKQLFMPIRIAVTGEQHGPDLIMSIFLLGKNKVLTRISNILTKSE